MVLWGSSRHSEPMACDKLLHQNAGFMAWTRVFNSYFSVNIVQYIEYCAQCFASNGENVFEFGVPVLHEILRELQVYVVSKLREKLNTIKQVLPLLHHFDTRARKSKLTIVKFQDPFILHCSQRGERRRREVRGRSTHIFYCRVSACPPSPFYYVYVE